MLEAAHCCMTRVTWWGIAGITSTENTRAYGDIRRWKGVNAPRRSARAYHNRKSEPARISRVFNSK